MDQHENTKQNNTKKPMTKKPCVRSGLHKLPCHFHIIGDGKLNQPKSIVGVYRAPFFQDSYLIIKGGRSPIPKKERQPGTHGIMAFLFGSLTTPGNVSQVDEALRVLEQAKSLGFQDIRPWGPTVPRFSGEGPRKTGRKTPKVWWLKWKNGWREVKKPGFCSSSIKNPH